MASLNPIKPQTLNDIPESERQQTPSVGYYGKRPVNKRSPYHTRQSKNAGRLDSDDECQGPSSSSGPSGGPSLAAKEPLSGSTGSKRLSSYSDGSSDQQRRSLAYCTQACLLSLMSGYLADIDCPNYEFHGNVSGQHHIMGNEIADLVHKRLSQDPDKGCQPLWMTGARGILFKIHLIGYDYIFVAKGSVDAFVPCLKYEAEIYASIFSLYKG